MDNKSRNPRLQILRIWTIWSPKKERKKERKTQRKFCANIEAQFDSESASSRMQEKLSKQGAILLYSTQRWTRFPEIFRKYFETVVLIAHNKSTLTQCSKWKTPLRAFFRINFESFGWFQRTLIINDEGAEVTHVEWCRASKIEISTIDSAVA
jgi:Fe-S cluster assembly protein SufB